jgi:hypothetical protein
MKKLIIPLIPVIFLTMALVSFKMPDHVIMTDLQVSHQDELNLGFPEDVTKILNNSCFGCHTGQSKNEKAKFKLNFSKWNDLKATTKIGKLDDICKMLKEGEMPPERFLSNNPDKALTAEQKTLMCNWVDEETKKLME